jgi:2-polyprenyl-6-methoxyphenol hydroxylase-like FAD-dependent oxidoreductase
MKVPGSTVIVIGSGVAGLLAAQALTDAFSEVTLIDRDHIGQSLAHRAGVPQDRHVHTLWAGGMRAIETLLPGLEQDLVAAGGSVMGFWSDFKWLLPSGHWLTRWPAVQQLVMSSRPLFEHTIRARVAAAGRVRMLDGHEVTGLRLGPTGAVSGVRVAPRTTDGAPHELSADLVVDAAGRRSGLTTWLAALNLPQPKESVIDPLVGYATRLFAIPADDRVGFKGLYIQLAPPEHTRGGIMFPIEDGRWIVTLLGACRDYPPTDEHGYLEFARSLRSSALFDTIEGAEPASPVWGHRHTANQRRHYERTAMPAGLLVLGDSLCAFNPIYGQGMTVAALQAQALRALARDHMRTASDASRLSRRAQGRMASIANQAWTVSANQDLRYPVTGGPGPAIRLLHGFFDRILLAATVDETVANTFLMVLNMMAPPTSLQRPTMLLRVLRGARRAGAR